jgi:hypothetical protein
MTSKSIRINIVACPVGHWLTASLLLLLQFCFDVNKLAVAHDKDFGRFITNHCNRLILLFLCFNLGCDSFEKSELLLAACQNFF